MAVIHNIEHIRDEQGRLVECIVDGDPKHENSFRREYDAKDLYIACTFGEDPDDECSWRIIDGYRVYGNGDRLKVQEA